jgi:hypothetical protein
VLRAVLSVLKWATIVVVALALVFVLINLRDEAPTELEQAMARARPAPVPDSENIYLALVGLASPAGEDPVAAGARAVIEYNAVAAKDPTGRAFEATASTAAGTKDAEARPLRFSGDVRLLRSGDKPSMLEFARGHADEIRRMVGANRELIERFEAMHRMARFADLHAPTAFGPFALEGLGELAINVHRLLKLRAALDMQSGRPAQAIDFVAQDVALWRRVLADGSDLINTSLATQLLQWDLELLGEFLSLADVDAAARSEALHAALAPLTGAGRSFEVLLEREFQVHVGMIDLMARQWLDDRGEDFASRARAVAGRASAAVFLKRTATLNTFAESSQVLIDESRMSPREFKHIWNTDDDPVRRFDIAPRYVYNPLGRMLAGISVYAYGEYIARTMDLAALFDLRRVQLAWRASKRDPANGRSAADGDVAVDPYTGEPFAWDAGGRSLSFEPISERARKGWNCRAALPRQ